MSKVSIQDIIRAKMILNKKELPQLNRQIWNPLTNQIEEVFYGPTRKLCNEAECEDCTCKKKEDDDR